MDAEGEIFAGLEEVDLFFQEQGVGAEIDVFFPGDEAGDDLFDLRVEQGLAPGDADHGGLAFLDGLEALLGGEIFLENVGGVLDFSAASACKIAAKEGFQHKNEGVSFFAGEFLPQHVGCDGPHLRDWNSHGSKSIPAGGGGLQWAVVKRRKWLVLTALAMEGKAITRALGGKTESEDVCVRVIGLGGVRLNRYPLEGFERIMLAGLGGALDPALAIGDIVCEGMGERSWPGLTVRAGKIYTADHLVDTFQEKARLFQETGCLAVEMEGAIVRRAVESTGATFVHIRAISDLAEQNVPKRMAGWIDEVGQPLVMRVVGDLIRHPTIASSMFRLGMQSATAVKRLGEIVRQVVQSPKSS
jgi:hypothetical protein